MLNIVERNPRSREWNFNAKAWCERDTKGNMLNLKEILVVELDIYIYVCIYVCRSYHRVRRAFPGDCGVRMIQFLEHHRWALLPWPLRLLLSVQLDDPAHDRIAYLQINDRHNNVRSDSLWHTDWACAAFLHNVASFNYNFVYKRLRI